MGLGIMSATEVIHFWFEEAQPAQHFAKDLAFDELIRSRFLDTHTQASQGMLHTWRDQPQGALAEVIVLDQFSRNLFRDTPQAFAYDSIALVLAQEAIRRKLDQQLNNTMKAYFYMPFMHSESPEIHELALHLFSAPGLEDKYDHELRHKTIIDRFGRYPHRNAILGRQSTAEELEYLQQPGAGF